MDGSFWFGMLLGIVATSLVFLVGVAGMVRGKKVSVNRNTVRGVVGALVVGMFVFGQAAATYAQTPVPLSIPTNVIFSETNNWLTTFAPIAAIGIGISIALAVLGYLGKMIKSAFT